jgi:hypothetical protein
MARPPVLAERGRGFERHRHRPERGQPQPDRRRQDAWSAVWANPSRPRLTGRPNWSSRSRRRKPAVPRDEIDRILAELRKRFEVVEQVLADTLDRLDGHRDVVRLPGFATK